ncbi:uncharacterized protein LAESUDRAFT_725481 [Laetiporus sulphureus 93-53]|uniref:DUF6699 domain-containing protein n=1 Tax=Laetiporus sulphureus 93-53 TaxID=1314785 RepID=A0A165EIC1_9APHY|nr:uncharacterized protein LAESUDRAFT_725481 [Laetiporus sulphureus 93-53]KZT07112.1 hypothetical protein LAESUDRAFT_725481 [Laetiporus sulphureus 93-53]
MRTVSSSKEPLKWISRLEHPALPPRPELWATPPLIPRQLPPSALQLNPFLQHRPFGRPPVLFDMRLFTADILLGELPREEGDERPLRADFEEWGPDGSQPATWPGVPSLYISALADDAFPKFPWPILVIPHHPSLPVLVRHVFNALIANFEERVKEDEMEALSEERRGLVTRAYYTRLETRVGGRLPGDEDGVRRIDYLGDQVYFRGLEPAPDGDGFMMFVGSA